MSVASDVDPEPDSPAKSSKMPLIIGVVLALLGAAGGFFSVRAGLIPLGQTAEAGQAETAEKEPAKLTEDVVFIPLDPITISLPPGSDRRLLRFVGQLDVAPANEAAVMQIKPRIVDVLNSYLRALQVSDLEEPTALIRLRSQMLHRINVVAGQGVVRDLLISEFVLN